MGEAKRKREHTQIVYDKETGEPLVARDAGSLLDFLAEPHAGRVPCNGCTSCCYIEPIEVTPEDEKPEDLAHLDLDFDDETNIWRLMKRPDGA